MNDSKVIPLGEEKDICAQFSPDKNDLTRGVEHLLQYYSSCNKPSMLFVDFSIVKAIKDSGTFFTIISSYGLCPFRVVLSISSGLLSFLAGQNTDHRELSQRFRLFVSMHFTYVDIKCGLTDNKALRYLQKKGAYLQRHQVRHVSGTNTFLLSQIKRDPQETPASYIASIRDYVQDIVIENFKGLVNNVNTQTVFFEKRNARL